MAREYRIRIEHKKDPVRTMYWVQTRVTIFGRWLWWSDMAIGCGDYTSNVCYGNMEEAKKWIDNEIGEQTTHNTYVTHP